MNFRQFLPFFLILLSICTLNGLYREPIYKFPTSETHDCFKECAVKRRIDPNKKGSFELHTLFAHAKMGESTALFFDLSNQYNGYAAKQSLLDKCNDDKAASKKDAKKLTTAKCVGNAEIEFTIFSNKEKKLRIKAGCKGEENNKYTPKYHLYSCRWEICKGNKSILVERPSRYDLRKIYYIDEKEMKKLTCLPKVCKVKPMEELHSTNLYDEKADIKTKRHKIFVECAVDRKNGHIETLIKNIPLDDNQILFFGISANIYVGRRSDAGMKDICENDKEAKMILPISYARLNLDKRKSNRLWFNYTIEGEEMENGKKVKSAKGTRKYKTEVLNVQLRTGKEEHCAAFTSTGAYNVLFCPSQICGKHKLILLRKTRKSAQGIKAKSGAIIKPAQEDTLMNKDGETVNVDHIYVVKMKQVEADVMTFLKRKCQGKLAIVEGVSRRAHLPSHSSSEAIGNAAHSKTESKKDKKHEKTEPNKKKEDGKKDHENPNSNSESKKDKKHEKTGHEDTKSEPNRKKEDDKKDHENPNSKTDSKKDKKYEETKHIRSEPTKKEYGKKSHEKPNSNEKDDDEKDNHRIEKNDDGIKKVACTRAAGRCGLQKKNNKEGPPLLTNKEKAAAKKGPAWKDTSVLKNHL